MKMLRNASDMKNLLENRRAIRAFYEAHQRGLVSGREKLAATHERSPPLH